MKNLAKCKTCKALLMGSVAAAWLLATSGNQDAINLHNELLAAIALAEGRTEP